MRTAFAAALAVAATMVAAAPASALLGHQGRWITDERGRVVVPHGVAVMDFDPPHTPEAIGFGDDDAAFLAAHGFGVVRVGMNWSELEPRPGVVDQPYVDSIARTVTTLAGHGIYSLLDMHQDGYGPLVGTDGAPDWATLTDGLPNVKVGFGPDYFVNPALERAFDNLWANTPGPGGVGIADRFGGALAALGARFADQPRLLGYDLFNEPWPGSQYATCMNPAGCPLFDAQLSAFYRRVIAALHAADRRHLTFAEPNLFFDFGANTNLADPGSDGFAFHDYCLGAGAGDALPNIPNSGPACAVEETTTLHNAEAYGDRTGSALINTEWAATDDLETTARMADELDAARMPWTFWLYNSRRLVADPRQPPTGQNVNSAALAILDRPYPRAIAGTPRDWRWNADTGTFTLRYAPARRGDSEIWTSPMHFPDGYRVQVTGARVVSPAGAAVLLLRNDPGALAVDLRLTPS